MMRAFGNVVLLVGLAVNLWTLLSIAGRDNVSLDADSTLILVMSSLAQAVALSLVYVCDREDYRSEIAGHRGRIAGALLKLWSIREDHHGEAQRTLSDEYKNRRAIIERGYYVYASRYFAWACIVAMTALFAYVVLLEG